MAHYKPGDKPKEYLPQIPKGEVVIIGALPVQFPSPPQDAPSEQIALEDLLKSARKPMQRVIENGKEYIVLGLPTKK